MLPSDHDLLNLIDCDLIAGTVVKLGGLWAFVIGYRLSVLDGAAVS